MAPKKKVEGFSFICSGDEDSRGGYVSTIRLGDEIIWRCDFAYDSQDRAFFWAKSHLIDEMQRFFRWYEK